MYTVAFDPQQCTQWTRRDKNDTDMTIIALDKIRKRLKISARKLRSGEGTLRHERKNRFYQKGDAWYFATREGADMGPFADREETLLSLLYYVERSQWLDPELLTRYREQRCFQ